LKWKKKYISLATDRINMVEPLTGDALEITPAKRAQTRIPLVILWNAA